MIPFLGKNIQSKFVTLASLADKACWLVGDGVALVLHGMVELRWFGPVRPKLGAVSAPARGCI